MSVSRRTFLKSAVTTACAPWTFGCQPKPLHHTLDADTPIFDPTRFEPGDVRVAPSTITPTVRFGITPFYSPEKQAPMLKLIRSYLEDFVGIPVETIESDTYQGCVARLQRGSLDVAQLSPYAFVRAEQAIDGLRLLAVAVARGATTYGSYLVMRREGDRLPIEATKGFRLGFTDRWSTSGYVYPMAYLMDKGFDVKNDFRVSFFGNHDSVLRALHEHEIDLAAVSSEVLVNRQETGLSGRVRIVAKTGRIPFDAVVARPGLPASVVKAIRAAFLKLSIHTERGREVLTDYNLINGFMPPPADHYGPVRRRARVLDSDDNGK